MANENFSPLLIDDTASLAECAYLRVREAIVDGTLAPGSKVSERTLAAAFGISPQPIREALRRLEGEGMVECRPRSGTFVAQFTVEQLVDMGRIRAALEGVAAGIAARRATLSDIKTLVEHLSAMQDATSLKDSAALADANDAFHLTLHGITENAILIRSLQALRAYFHFGSRRVLGTEEQHLQALAEHTAIVAAITEHNTERAETLMRAHALRSLQVAFPDKMA